MNSDQVETFPNECFYSFELEKASTCELDKSNNQTYDSRYKDAGLSISSYELQQANGVLT